VNSRTSVPHEPGGVAVVEVAQRVAHPAELRGINIRNDIKLRSRLKGITAQRSSCTCEAGVLMHKFRDQSSLETFATTGHRGCCCQTCFFSCGGGFLPKSGSSETPSSGGSPERTYIYRGIYLRNQQQGFT